MEFISPKIEIGESNTFESQHNSSQIITNESFVIDGEEISIEPKMEPEDENFFVSNPSDVKLQIKNKLISKMKRKRSGNEPKISRGNVPTLVYTQYPINQYPINHYTPQYTSAYDLQNMAESHKAKKSRIEFLNNLKEQNRAIKEQETQMRNDRRQKRREDREKRKNEMALKNSDKLPPQPKGLSYSDGTVSKYFSLSFKGSSGCL